MLSIFFGHACNFSCSYCVQSIGKDSVNFSKITPEFVENVTQLLKKQTSPQISYWGGETLLYFKQVKELHLALLANGVKFEFVKLVSNGSVITEEIVAFMNEHNFFMQLSEHHEFGNANYDLISKLKQVSISFIFTNKEPDAIEFFERVRALEEKYDREFFVYLHWVRATDACDASYYFTWESLKRHEEYLWSLLPKYLAGDRLIRSFFYGHLKTWEKALNAPSDRVVEPRCFASDSIDLDLKGNRYICRHNVHTPYSVGNHFRKIPILTESEAKATKRASTFLSTKECQACPINNWCRGDCSLSNTHEIDCRISKVKHQLLCEISKIEDGKTRINSIEV